MSATVFSRSTEAEEKTVPSKYVRKETQNNGDITEYSYYPDKTLQQIKTTFSNGIVSNRIFFYDEQGLSRIDYGNFSKGVSYSGTLQYRYQNGQLFKSQYYDDEGILVSETYYNISNANGRVSCITHYNNGILVFRRTYGYDQNNNIASITVNFDSEEAEYDFTSMVTYDDKKNIYGHFPLGFLHDSQGFNIHEGANNPLTVIAANLNNGTTYEDIVFSYTYDEEGYPTSITENYENNIITTTIEYY